MRFVLALLTCLVAVSAARAETVGYRKLRLEDRADRPLEAAVWYPATGGVAELKGGNAAFVGEWVVPDAAPAAGRHPLVVLSHGYGGHLGNQAWLAVALAARGYVVAAVNHPGTTARNRDPAIGARLWERPHDLSRLIDRLATERDLGAATDRVGVVGHSLGGWTAIELAGGRFDPARFDAECRKPPELVACHVIAELGAGRDATSRAQLAQDLRDRRVAAAVSLDLGLARGFDPASLAAIELPVLVMSADEGGAEGASALESGALAAALPPGKARLATLPGAAHFSFLPVCKPGAAELLEADTPGDGIICRDGAPDAGRAALHARAVDEIDGFLRAALGAP